MTQGMKTSEFWMALFVFAVSMAATVLYDVKAGEIGAATAPILAYIGNRAYVKGKS